MKKIYILILGFFLLPCITFASTKTYERDSTTLSVSSDITITDLNRGIILNTPLVDEHEKIYDFADLFTDSEEESLYSKVKDYISSFNIDMVIVTIDHNNKGSAREYADDFFDYNNFGIGNKHDGILYLIDMDTREVYISTSGKGISMYSSSKVDKLLDRSYNYLKKKDYYGSVTSFIDYATTINNKSVNFVISFLVSFALATIVVLIFKSKHKGIRLATNADFYLDLANSKELVKNDKFISTHTTKRPIPRDTGGSSGTHTSSSGRSHGGGGRHF